MSAESGVATFRDAQTGLWETFDPDELASPGAWRRQPDVVWAWYLWRHYLVGPSNPMPVTSPSRPGRPRRGRVVTQNIDNLHERAGSQQCAPAWQPVRFSLRDLRSAVHGELPEMPEPRRRSIRRCATCGGSIRPDIVWFGEALPDQPWQRRSKRLRPPTC